MTFLAIFGLFVCIFAPSTVLCDDDVNLSIGKFEKKFNVAFVTPEEEAKAAIQLAEAEKQISICQIKKKFLKQIFFDNCGVGLE